MNPQQISTVAGADAPLIVHDADQLRTLQATPTLLSRHTLIIDLRGLSPEASRAAAERIVSYGNECGCALGAACLGLGFAISVVWLVLGHGLLTTAFIWRLPWTLPCAFAAAGIGKWLGIARARARLNREIDRLILSQTTPASEV